MMKAAVLLTLCFLCATAAVGQITATVASGATMSSTFQATEHTELAAPQPMPQERSLLGTSNVYIAHGEMPLSEVPLPPVHVTPLGDLARMQKAEHAKDKKASIVWEN